MIVRTRGVRAHSARAWIGENAIHKAAPVLARLAEYRPRDVPVDGLVYREGLNAVRIGGGVAGNVIPDLCEIEVNYRFAPSRSAEEAEQHVRDVFDGFDVEVVDLAAGARPGLDAPLAQEFVAAVGGEAAPEVRLDRCRALLGDGRARRQLRAGRPAPGAPRRGARAGRADRGRRTRAAGVVERALTGSGRARLASPARTAADRHPLRRGARGHDGCS